MKLIPLASVMALTLTALALPAAPANAQGFFIDGRVGQSDLKDVPDAKDDTAFVIGGGYWFNQAFGIEAGYANLYDRNLAGGKAELDGFYAGVKGRALFDRGNGTGFFVGGRGGAYRWDGKAGAFSDDGTDWYAGAFAGYQFTPAFNVSVNVDRFRADDLDTDLIGAGAEFRF